MVIGRNPRAVSKVLHPATGGSTMKKFFVIFNTKWDAYSIQEVTDEGRARNAIGDLPNASTLSSTVVEAPSMEDARRIVNAQRPNWHYVDDAKRD